jgi:1,4-alpha-glucan branching enzyme
LKDAAQSVFAWLRRDDQGGQMLVVCNFTPVPRPGYRIGVPEGAARWTELLNTDSAHYGGSNLGNGSAPLAVESVPALGRAHSLALTLPPLSTLFLAPA